MQYMKATESKKPEIKKTKAQVKDVEHKVSYYEAVGRRKEASARIRLYIIVGSDQVVLGEHTLKAGDILVNKRPAEAYFPGEPSKRAYLEPLRTTNTLARFAVSASIDGGGSAGQLQAFIHGVSRALLIADADKFRPILKKRGFLTRDARVKERRKAGKAQKARAGKQSPKR